MIKNEPPVQKFLKLYNTIFGENETEKEEKPR